MGLHLPGASFVNPGTPLRRALTEEAARRATHGCTPIGEILDERALVNGVVALLATGGSTNHTMHLVAVAAAAGLQLTWDDFADLSAAVPLLARVYPNGGADINHFHAAGGMPFLLGELLDAGLLHPDVDTVAGHGLGRYRDEPYLDDEGELRWRPAERETRDGGVLRPARAAFAPDGGIRVLDGALGRAVIKVSAVAPEHRVVTAPARVFDDQSHFLEAFDRGDLDHDHVAVVRNQGPRANGMPELHKLTPALGVLQDRGHRVALVTDGRMSGASGKVPAAIHCTPEAAAGGPLSRVRDGDVVRLDAETGRLDVDVDLGEREPYLPALAGEGTGRELFAAFRERVGRPDEGASVFAPARDTVVRMSLTVEDLVSLAPVIPVVVIDELEDAVPLAAALVARRPAGDRGDAADAGRRCGDRADRRRGAGRGRRRGHGHDVASGRRGARRRRAVPGLAGRDADAARRAAGQRRAVPARDGDGVGHRRAARARHQPREAVPGRGRRRRRGAEGVRRAVPADAVLPDGGVDAANARDYLAQPNVVCVGGSWMLPNDATASKDWSTRRSHRGHASTFKLRA